MTHYRAKQACVHLILFILIYMFLVAIGFAALKLLVVNNNNHFVKLPIVKLRRGSGKDRQAMAPKAKGLKA